MDANAQLAQQQRLLASLDTRMGTLARAIRSRDGEIRRDGSLQAENRNV